MTSLIIIAALLTGLWVLRQAGRMDPRAARKFGARVLGAGLIAAGGLFSFHGNFALGVPVLGIGAGLMGWGNLFAQKPAFSANRGGTNQQPANQGAMDRKEAYAVLGLDSGATPDEINAAFKRLQRANHPDAGGSTYLAAKINQARDLLLKK
ncbi:hypothetical protein [Aestuariivirga litoralis]|uniref:hypothetical protein n=1 Tax=Aestuariivirga litoralis TaxID=2650924 RepID=UPI0018C75DBB|nr:hypothetical protein [Aestuariivirga litoralis]MBG1231627.1 hypothetical protein [Aestuariivirga litoralis]